jgi:hypothetical protein
LKVLDDSLASGSISLDEGLSFSMTLTLLLIPMLAYRWPDRHTREVMAKAKK